MMLNHEKKVKQKLQNQTMDIVGDCIDYKVIASIFIIYTRTVFQII